MSMSTGISTPQETLAQVGNELDKIWLPKHHNAFLTITEKTSKDLFDNLTNVGSDLAIKKLTLIKYTLQNALTAGDLTDDQPTQVETIKNSITFPVDNLQSKINALFAHIGGAAWKRDPLNTEDNRHLGEAIEQKLYVLGINTQKQFDALVKNPDAQTLLLDIFSDVGYTTQAKMTLQKAIRMKKEYAEKKPTLDTIDNSQKENILTALVRDTDVKNALQEGYTDKQKKVFWAYRDAVIKNDVYRGIVWDYYKNYLTWRSHSGSIDFASNGNDFLESDAFRDFKRKTVDDDVVRGAIYADLNDTEKWLVRNGGILDLQIDPTTKKGTFTIPTWDIVVVKPTNHLHEWGKTEPNVVAKDIIIDDGTTQKHFSPTASVPLHELEGGGKTITAKLEVKPHLEYDSKSTWISLEFKTPPEEITLDMSAAQLNALLNALPVEKPSAISIDGIDYTKGDALTSLPTYLRGKVMPGAWVDIVMTDSTWGAVTLATPNVQADGSFSIHLPVLPNGTYRIEMKSTYNGKVSAPVEFFQKIDLPAATAEQPNNFPFPAKDNVTVSTVVESDLVPITWITVPAEARCTLWDIRVRGWAWIPAGTPLTVNPNEEIQVRVTSHANHDTIVNSVVTVNGKPSIFRVKTELAAGPVGPETPGDFPFLPKENVAVSTVVESDLVPITWITVPAEARCTLWDIRVRGWAWIPAGTPLMVNPNEEIQVRVTSHANHDTIVNSVVTVNGKPSIFTVKTAADVVAPTRTQITEPWRNVFQNNPVVLKGTAWNNAEVQIQEYVGGAWVNVWGVITSNTTWEWQLSLWRMTVGNHRLRAVPLDSVGTLRPLLAYEHTFEVGHFQIGPITTTRAGWILTNVACRMDVSAGEQLKIGYKTPWSTTVVPLIDQVPAAAVYDLDEDVNLPHGKYTLVVEHYGKKEEKEFEVQPQPLVVNPLVGNQRRQRLTGTGEPNEQVVVKMSIWGNPEKTYKPIVWTDGTWSIQLDDLVSGPCTLEATCAGNTIRQQLDLDIPNRRPILNNPNVVVNEWQQQFDVSGYLPRNCLDCDRVLIKIWNTTIRSLDLGNRTRGGAFRDAGRNIANLSRQRRHDNSFETDLTIADLALELWESKSITIVPVGRNGTEYTDESATMTVEYREHIRQKHAVATEPAGVVTKSDVTFAGTATKWVKRVRVWKEWIGLWHSRFRWKNQMEYVPVDAEGNWKTTKTIKNDGNYSYRVAAVDDQWNIWPSSPIDFSVKIPENAYKKHFWKPWTRFRKKPKEDGEKDNKSENAKEWKGWSESWKSSWWGMFGFLKDILQGDIAATRWLDKNVKFPNQWVSMWRFYGWMIDGKNELTDKLSGSWK
jgi:uncharacterized pyridoxamine 5'-phosphate oxidase family protein